MLAEEDGSADITRKVEDILQKYQILELRFPMGFEVDPRVGEQALAILHSHSSQDKASTRTLRPRNTERIWMRS